MQFSTTFLLLALSAGALALPANQTSILEARAERGAGSIAAFDATDCSGAPHGPRPQDENGCIAFSGATNNIGINWGSGFFMGRAHSLYVYKDKDCKVFAASPIMASQYNNAKGTNACVSMKDIEGPWGSVSFCHDEKGCN